MSAKLTTTALTTTALTTAEVQKVQKSQKGQESQERALVEIKSLAGYRPERIGDNQILRNDWRLLTTHWAKHVRGEATSWPKEAILVAAIKLATHLCKKSAIVFHPLAMKPGARDLYDKVKAELDALQVPIPHALTAEELKTSFDDLSDLSDQQLSTLHNNLHHTWKDNNLNRKDVWNAHKLVVEEFKQRGLKHILDAKSKLDRPLVEGAEGVPADKESDERITDPRALREMLSPDCFVPVVVTTDVLSLTGSVCYGVEPNDYDWVVRGGGNLPLPLIKGALDDFLPHVDNHVFDDPLGPSWDHISLGDLVAWPSGAELPETRITQAPEGFEWLKGLPAFYVRRRWLGLIPGGEILFVVGGVSGGTALKLERIWYDRAVTIASVPVLPSNVISIADLVFWPYLETELVQLPEPEFRKQALAFWQTSPGDRRMVRVLGVTDPAFEAAELVEAKHSRSRCMKEGCDSPPVIDVHWADGRGRAWFCLPHFEQWAKQEDREIVRAWFIRDGKIPKKIGQGDGEQILKLNARLSVDKLVSRLKTLVQSLAEARAQAKLSLTPFEPFVPCKASEGYREAEFTATDSLWKYWAAGYLEDP